MSKTVWNNITHLRNFFSGPSFLLANGVMPLLTNPDAVAKSVRVISNELLSAFRREGTDTISIFKVKGQPPRN